MLAQPPDRPIPRRTVVVIPACNEAGRVELVLDGLRALCDAPEITAKIAFDVVVIDDGSEDATGALARAHGAVVLRHPYNLGYGTALQTAYLYARHHDYDQLVQMDADGQHDPASVRDLIAALDQGYDLVVGSRFQQPGHAPQTTALRRLGSRLFAWIVTRWTGTRITDPTSGFQGLSRAAITELAADGFPEDYPDADVLIRLASSGLKLCEIPVKMHPRVGGVSMHRGARAAFYAYKMFLSLALLKVRRSSPYRTAS